MPSVGVSVGDRSKCCHVKANMFRGNGVKFIFLTFAITLLLFVLWKNRSDSKNDRVPTNLKCANGVINQTLTLKSEWSPPIVPGHIQHLDQKDPQLIHYIRQHWIISPATGRIHLDPVIYEYRERDDFSEQGQVKSVLNLLNGRRNGFFVECGAADGQRNSNSLYLEIFMNWTGLLIEADPSFFSQLQAKNRHAYLVNACLSPKTKPMIVDFSTAGVAGGISEFVPKSQRQRRKMDEKKPIKVQCFPLYSILAAIGISHVDYFSLDIEGAEVDVLKTIPFGDVIMDVISVEKRILYHRAATKEKENQIISLLSPYGFALKKRLVLDLILARS